jgi:acetyltransferase-like isoleucine patch superfamily enzyme
VPGYNGEHQNPFQATILRMFTTRDVLVPAPKIVLEMLAARFYLRRCTEVGAFTRLSGRRPRINNRGRLIIGEHVRLLASLLPIELATMPRATLVIGDRSCLKHGVSIAAHQSIAIGRGCLLDPYVNIQDNDWHDVVDRARTPPSKPVTIGDNVWLGTRTIILPGVTIGSDTVVGAGSVVVNDIPPQSLAIGNPARVIRKI